MSESLHSLDNWPFFGVKEGLIICIGAEVTFIKLEMWLMYLWFFFLKCVYL